MEFRILIYKRITLNYLQLLYERVDLSSHPLPEGGTEHKSIAPASGGLEGVEASAN